MSTRDGEIVSLLAACVASVRKMSAQFDALNGMMQERMKILREQQGAISMARKSLEDRDFEKLPPFLNSCLRSGFELHYMV